jgi:hypothetical protein
MRCLPRALIATLTLSTLLSAPVAAQTAPPDSGFRLRVGGDIAVAPGEREGAVVVIRGNGRVAGVVGALIVIDGTARIDSGRVGELVVIRGSADLNEGAVVTGDVHLVESTIDVAPGAIIEGRIERGVGRRFAREAFTVIALIGLGVLAALIVAGVLAALVVPNELVGTGELIRTDTGLVVGAAALVWLAFPILAVLLVPTIVGLPFGLGYLLFVMPLLGFLGLIVAGTWIGGLLLRKMSGAGKVVNPAAAAALGITLLLLVGRVPILGFVATALVLLGAGAVSLRVTRAVQRRGRASADAPQASGAG